MQDNNLPDFSWATYKDPDKIELEKKIAENQKKVEEFIDKIVEEEMSQKRSVSVPVDENKKDINAFKSKKKRAIMTSLSISVASIVLINIMTVHAAKKPEVSDDYVETKVEDVVDKVLEENLTTEPVKVEVKENLPEVDDQDLYHLTTSATKTIGEETDVEKQEVKTEVKVQENNYTSDYRDVCINVPQEATRYLTEDVYSMMINDFGPYIEKYSNMYGVDPNFVASLIMVESPDYDINNDYDYHKIGLGQYKGEYFDNDTFTTYNYVTDEMDKYTVHVENLYANPEEQIKMICITVATSAKEYDYNLVAIMEHHNKGCGSLSTSLEKIQNEKGYASKEDVLKYEDQNEIIENMPEIGDPRYSYKIAYYMQMCLDKNTFGDEKEIVFKDHDNNTEHRIDFKINTMQRS